MIKVTALIGISAVAVEAKANAESNRYYAGTTNCSTGKVHQVIIVKPDENSFEYYFNEFGRSYKGVGFEGEPETATYDYSHVRGIDINEVSDEQISFHILKNNTPYQACMSSTLKRVPVPGESYSDLLSVIQEGDYSPEAATKVYDLQSSLIPPGLVPGLERTSDLEDAMRAAQKYWPSYFDSNAQRIKAMPVETQVDVENVRAEIKNAFDPDFGGSEDYLLDNRPARAVVFDVLDTVTKNALRNDLEFAPVTDYESEKHFCVIAEAGSAGYGDHGIEVFGGTPYLNWTRSGTEKLIASLENCSGRDAKRMARQVRSHYERYIVPQQQAWKKQLREEELERQRQAELEQKREEERKRREEERRREQKLAKERSGAMLEQLASWIEEAKELPVDRETFIETEGYKPKDLGPKQYTTAVYDLQGEYLAILEAKRTAIREEITSEIPQRVRITDQQLLDDVFSFEAFKQDLCGMPELKQIRDGYIQSTLQDHCLAYIDEAKQRQQTLLIEELAREREQSCDAFIDELDLSDDLTEAEFSLNIPMPNGEKVSTAKTRDLFCQMNRNGDLRVESQGWFSNTYKVTYSVDNTAKHDELRKKTEEVSQMITDPEKIGNFEASLGMLNLIINPTAMSLEKASVAFEIEKDEDFGTWGVTTVKHSVLGKLDGETQANRTKCAITPTQYGCAEVSGG